MEDVEHDVAADAEVVKPALSTRKKRIQRAIARAADPVGAAAGACYCVC